MQQSLIPTISSREELQDLINKTKYLDGDTYYSDASFFYSKDEWKGLFSLSGISLNKQDNRSINSFIKGFSTDGDYLYYTQYKLTFDCQLINDSISIGSFGYNASNRGPIASSAKVQSMIDMSIKNSLGDINTILATLTTPTVAEEVTE